MHPHKSDTALGLFAGALESVKNAAAAAAARTIDTFPQKQQRKVLATNCFSLSLYSQTQVERGSKAVACWLARFVRAVRASHSRSIRVCVYKRQRRETIGQEVGRHTAGAQLILSYTQTRDRRRVVALLPT